MRTAMVHRRPSLGLLRVPICVEFCETHPFAVRLPWLTCGSQLHIHFEQGEILPLYGCASALSISLSLSNMYAGRFPEVVGIMSD